MSSATGIRKPRIGLALGSGSARGWAHIGVIETLVEAGIVPDVVCGTSMGALVGGVYASGRLAGMTDWAMKADWRVVASLIDMAMPSGGLVDGSKVVAWLERLELAPDIENLPIPYAAVATDLVSGREIWLQSGSLSQAIRASISIPGVFSPVERDGAWLADGALVNPVPISLCRALGAEFIIAVNLNENRLSRRVPRGLRKLGRSPAPKPDWLESVLNHRAMGIFGDRPAAPRYFDVLSSALNIMQDRITSSRLAGEPPDVMVAPRLGELESMDFDRAAFAIEEGRAATRLVLPLIRERLGAVAGE